MPTATIASNATPPPATAGHLDATSGSPSRTRKFDTWRCSNKPMISTSAAKTTKARPRPRATSQLAVDTCCTSRKNTLNLATTNPRAAKAIAVVIQAKESDRQPAADEHRSMTVMSARRIALLGPNVSLRSPWPFG